MEKKETYSVYPSKKLAILLFIATIIILFLTIWLFTRNSVIAGFDLSNKGAIGDAINGITGPIIALISAALLFYSFQAQLEANRRQLEANKMLKSQWEFDTYYRLYNEIERAYIEDLQTMITTYHINGNDEKEYVGAGYIEYVTTDLLCHYDGDEDDEMQKFFRSHLNSIEFFMEDILVLINYVRDSNVNQKHFFLHRINRFYSNRLELSIDELYNKLPKNTQFQKSHSLHHKLTEILASIRKNELKYDILG